MAAGTELATAYIHIIPSTQGFGSSLSSQVNSDSKGCGGSAGSVFGSGFVSAVTKIIAAAGIGAAVGKALTEGAALQQAVGGVETLFGDVADQVKSYANEAFSSAGLSANDYMETVAGFAATLMQGLGDDTSEAANIANKAVTDMSDNANKMGTDMASIQAAYQGFAKDNYTMLDNLKLGYGGTQSEMARLINDTGVLGDGIEVTAETVKDVPFDKIIEAIHQTQEQMGITGTTAEEAATTFSGSMAAMRASAVNVLAALTNPEDMDLTTAMQSLRNTVSTFLLDNLFPMIGNLLGQLPALIGGASGLITGLLNMITANAPAITQGAIQFVTQLTEAIVTNAPYMIGAALALVGALAQAFMAADWATIGQQFITSLSNAINTFAGESFGADSAGQLIQMFASSITTQLPVLMQKGTEMLNNLLNGIMQALPGIITTVGNIRNQLTESFMQAMPSMIQSGTQLMMGLLNGFTQAFPGITQSAIEVTAQFLDTVVSNLPQILSVGIDMVLQLVDGITSTLPQIVESAAQIAVSLINELISHLPELISAGMELCAKLSLGMIQAGPKVLLAIGKILKSICDATMKIDWVGLGVNIIKGIIKGLQSMASAVVEALLNIIKAGVDAVKKWLGIKSPSRLMAKEVGQWIPAGIATGMQNNMSTVTDAMREITDATAGTFNVGDVAAGITATTGTASENTSVLARLDAILALMVEYMPEMASASSVETGINMTKIDRSLGTAVI